MCGLMAVALTQPCTFQEVPIVARINKKKGVLGGVLYSCMDMVCLWMCIGESACHLCGLLADEMSHWVLRIAEQDCRGMGKSTSFFVSLSNFGLRCMCPSVLLQSLAVALVLSLSSHCLLFFFYTCFFKSSFLTRCTGPHTKGIIISLVFWIPIKLCVKRVKKCADCESEPPQVLPSASVLCQVIASNFLTLHGR